MSAGEDWGAGGGGGGGGEDRGAGDFNEVVVRVDRRVLMMTITLDWTPN